MWSTSTSTRTPGSTSAATASRARRTPSTRGSATPATSRTSAARTTIMALVEGRGRARGEVGMAALDLHKPVVELAQFSDSAAYGHTFAKLQLHEPRDILMPNTMCETQASKLFAALQEQQGELSIVSIPRKFFSEERGLQQVKELSAVGFETVLFEVQDKYYALAACAALLKYLEHHHNMLFATESLRFVYRGSHSATIIDAVSVRHLELLQSARNPSDTEHCLYGVLNHTVTDAGGRLLRSELMQPPCSLNIIEPRLQAVEEMAERDENLQAVRELLKKILDLDRIVAVCVQIPKSDDAALVEYRLVQLIHLRQDLGMIEPLKLVCQQFKSQLLSSLQSKLTNERFAHMLAAIDRVLHPDIQLDTNPLSVRSQRIFAVRPGLHGMLDIARRTYTESVADVTELANQMRDMHSVEDLSVAYNQQRGFFFRTSVEPSNLPAIFERVERKRNVTTCTTTALQQLNARINESIQEIFNFTSSVIASLIQDIQKDITCLYQYMEAVAILDLVCALAQTRVVAPTNHMVKPEFSGTLAVSQGYHPILALLPTNEAAIVPNEIYASEDANFIIITGPNMSGKSIYLRQVALLQIMAQIGAYVPAAYACFRPADRIFTRIGSDDSIEANASSFALECQELTYILQHATDRSVIIMDELGRSTTPEDGFGICFAASEQLLQIKAFTFLATHFLDMAKLSMYPNVEVFHMVVEQGEDSGQVTTKFTHTLRPGVTPATGYGLELANRSGLPAEVLQLAKAIRQTLNSHNERLEEVSDPASVEARTQHKLVSRLIQAARDATIDPESLRPFLQALQAEFRQAESRA